MQAIKQSIASSPSAAIQSPLAVAVEKEETGKKSSDLENLKGEKGGNGGNGGISDSSVKGEKYEKYEKNEKLLGGKSVSESYIIGARKVAEEENYKVSSDSSTNTSKHVKNILMDSSNDRDKKNNAIYQQNSQQNSFSDCESDIGVSVIAWDETGRSADYDETLRVEGMKQGGVTVTKWEDLSMNDVSQDGYVRDKDDGGGKEGKEGIINMKNRSDSEGGDNEALLAAIAMSLKPPISPSASSPISTPTSPSISQPQHQLQHKSASSSASSSISSVPNSRRTFKADTQNNPTEKENDDGMGSLSDRTYNSEFASKALSASGFSGVSGVRSNTVKRKSAGKNKPVIANEEMTSCPLPRKVNTRVPRPRGGRFSVSEKDGVEIMMETPRGDGSCDVSGEQSPKEGASHCVAQGDDENDDGENSDDDDDDDSDDSDLEYDDIEDEKEAEKVEEKVAHENPLEIDSPTPFITASIKESGSSSDITESATEVKGEKGEKEDESIKVAAEGPTDITIDFRDDVNVVDDVAAPITEPGETVSLSTARDIDTADIADTADDIVVPVTAENIVTGVDGVVAAPVSVEDSEIPLGLHGKGSDNETVEIGVREEREEGAAVEKNGVVGEEGKGSLLDAEKEEVKEHVVVAKVNDQIVLEPSVISGADTKEEKAEGGVTVDEEVPVIPMEEEAEQVGVTAETDAVADETLNADSNQALSNRAVGNSDESSITTLNIDSAVILVTTQEGEAVADQKEDEAQGEIVEETKEEEEMIGREEMRGGLEMKEDEVEYSDDDEGREGESWKEVEDLEEQDESVALLHPFIDNKLSIEDIYRDRDGDMMEIKRMVEAEEIQDLQEVEEAEDAICDEDVRMIEIEMERDDESLGDDKITVINKEKDIVKDKEKKIEFSVIDGKGGEEEEVVMLSSVLNHQSNITSIESSATCTPSNSDAEFPIH